MLVLRDNYYSSPLIMDEGEYLEKMFGAASTEFKELARSFYKSRHGVDMPNTTLELIPHLMKTGEVPGGKKGLRFLRNAAKNGDSAKLPKKIREYYSTGSNSPKRLGDLPQEDRVIIKKISKDLRNRPPREGVNLADILIKHRGDRAGAIKAAKDVGLNPNDVEKIANEMSDASFAYQIRRSIGI